MSFKNKGWSFLVSKTPKSIRKFIKSFVGKFLYVRFYGPRVHVCTNLYANRLLRQAKEDFNEFTRMYGKRRCFVIGNGPSLNKLDLTRLKDEVTIGSNGIYKNHNNMRFYPTFYTVTNYLIAEQMGPEISKIRESKKIFPIFINHYFKETQSKITYLDAVSAMACSTDVTKWISWASTVTFFNIQIAASLGCPQIYLIGVDNEYAHRPIDKGGDIIKQKGSDMNHFSADYFSEGFKWQAADTNMMAAVYELAEATFNKDSPRIMNATLGGKLEVFPRVDYKDLF